MSDTIHERAVAELKHLRAFVKLYLSTYADTDTHPTAMQEAEVVQRARTIMLISAKEKEQRERR